MSLLNDLMNLTYQITCTALGIDPTTYPQNILPLYGPESPPGLKDPYSDFIFYRIQFGDEPISRQIDDLTGVNTDPTIVTQQIQYVRSLIMNWQTYGNNGFENADTIRARLYDSDIKTMLEDQSVSLITDIPEPTYIPEPKGQQWYQRYDLYAKFNQLVTKTTTIPAVSGTEISIVTEKGVVSTCSVSTQS